MEWQAQEAPQTPGENAVTLEGPFIPGEEGVKEGVKLESAFDEVAEGGGEDGDADGVAMEVTYAAADVADAADGDYEEGNAREGEVDTMDEDGATAALSVGVPHSAGASPEEGGGAQGPEVCVTQQEEDLSEPVVIVNHAQVVASEMIDKESGNLIDGIDGASAAAGGAAGQGGAASGAATSARAGNGSSGNGNRIADGPLAQSGGVVGKSAGAGAGVGEKVAGRLEGEEASGTAASVGTTRTGGGGSKGTAAAGGAVAGGGKTGSGRGRGGGGAATAVASTSGTTGGTVGAGRGRKAQQGEGQAQAKTPAKRMKKVSAGPAGEADAVVASAKAPKAAAVSPSPAQQLHTGAPPPPPPPPTGSAEKASPAPSLAMAAPSAKPAAKRPGSSPMSVTYAVQCGRCHKWRRVTSVEEYEKIRARGPTDSSWMCGEAAAWKKNGGTAAADGRDYCAEPSELEPDGRLTWALDKPHIPRTPPGWRRRVAVRGGSAKKFADVYYYSPCNKQLRSIVEVERFLLENPMYKEKYGLTKDNFSFAAPRAYPVGSPLAPKSGPMSKDATVRSGDGMIVDSAIAEQDKKDRSASVKGQTATASSGGTVARSGGPGSGARNGTVEGRNTSGEQSIASGDMALSTPVRGGTGHGSGKMAVEAPGAVVAHRTPLLPHSLANNAPSSSHADMLSPSSQFHVFGTSLTECPPSDTSVISDVPLPSGELPPAALPQPADVSPAMATEPDFVAGEAVDAGEPEADDLDGMHCEMANGEGGKVADGAQDADWLSKTDGAGTENGGDGEGQCG
ncbi:hypothetical protein CBR_g37407 [Chara braunii]|uniref:MBD domain-containing protein n=1 Tax=Chara braunii TaxID=69332 RepID=A0A388LN05_CHABU|nr:hypothetical protein CBR_g37407 [Chara braunii]|eukprot:GBG83603.1 hypothetical protein CBR_g37407 [Chara braunii]